MQSFSSFPNSPRYTSTPYGKQIPWYLNWSFLLQCVSSTGKICTWKQAFQKFCIYKIVIKFFLLSFIFHPLQVKFSRYFSPFFVYTAYWFALMHTEKDLLKIKIKSWTLTNGDKAEVCFMPFESYVIIWHSSFMLRLRSIPAVKLAEEQLLK